MDKDAAIDCFKVAIELIKGDMNKQNLAFSLCQLLSEVNRDFEFTPYQKYLPENNLAVPDEHFE
jgi:hypothetical protein